jgi:hypothetical protein
MGWAETIALAPRLELEQALKECRELKERL